MATYLGEGERRTSSTGTCFSSATSTSRDSVAAEKLVVLYSFDALHSRKRDNRAQFYAFDTI
jgi:hypothetical protein